MMIERQGKRTGERRLKALSARALVAGVLALFVVLQGLTAIGSSLTRSIRGGGETSFVASLLGVTCAVHAQDSDRPPNHDHSRAQCCILCGGRDLDSAPLFAVAQPSVTFTPSPALDSIERRPEEPHLEPPVGWASSWSSQAPPIFS